MNRAILHLQKRVTWITGQVAYWEKETGKYAASMAGNQRAELIELQMAIRVLSQVQLKVPEPEPDEEQLI